jgi:hypothetical protein
MAVGDFELGVVLEGPLVTDFFSKERDREALSSSESSERDFFVKLEDFGMFRNPLLAISPEISPFAGRLGKSRKNGGGVGDGHGLRRWRRGLWKRRNESGEVEGVIRFHPLKPTRSLLFDAASPPGLRAGVEVF